MRKIVICAVLTMLLVAFALPVCGAHGGPQQPPSPPSPIPSDRPLAEVTLDGTLTVAPRIMLRLASSTVADAVGDTAKTSVEYSPGMVLGSSATNCPSPDVTTYVVSNGYLAEVYSNDSWKFFIYRTDVTWSGGGRDTELPFIYYSKDNGANWSLFDPNVQVGLTQTHRATDNTWHSEGTFKFKAGFDAGTRPGTYSFTVGFVAYQE